MGESREREQRLVEIRRALDESDLEERMEEEDDVEALAQRWEKVVKRDTSFEGR